ncbi:MAG: hypothetical protein HY951_09830 [Bacteroidia bacterium]|nr:hypothetical protein [Bacteroidia bacterium]
MKLDNKDAYDRIRGQFVLAIFIAATLISFSVFYDYLTLYFIPISNLAYAIIFSSLFIIYIIYRLQLKYHFIIYDDEGDKIVIRYYPVTSFITKYISIEIPFDSLFKIEIKRTFFNQREELIVHQTTKKGIAKYKPIPLTALTNNQKRDLINALNSLAKVKM